MFPWIVVPPCCDVTILTHSRQLCSGQLVSNGLFFSLNSSSVFSNKISADFLKLKLCHFNSSHFTQWFTFLYLEFSYYRGYTITLISVRVKVNFDPFFEMQACQNQIGNSSFLCPLGQFCSTKNIVWLNIRYMFRIKKFQRQIDIKRLNFGKHWNTLHP